MVARERWSNNEIVALPLDYSPKNERKLMAICLLQVVIQHNQPFNFGSFLVDEAYLLGFDV